MIESSIQSIPYPQESVYSTLSDLNNLEKFREHIPADQLKDLSFDSDSLSFSLAGVGKVSLQIVNREPCKCIKFQTVQSPVQVTLWVQVVSTGPESCKMKLTLDPQVGGIMSKMLYKPLRQGLEKPALAFDSIRYDNAV